MAATNGESGEKSVTPESGVQPVEQTTAVLVIRVIGDRQAEIASNIDALCGSQGKEDWALSPWTTSKPDRDSQFDSTATLSLPADQAQHVADLFTGPWREAVTVSHATTDHDRDDRDRGAEAAAA